MPRIHLGPFFTSSLLLVAAFILYRNADVAFGSSVKGFKQVVLKNQQHFESVKTSDEGEGFTRSIVAVGDLHGDYENALHVLNMANVVDKEGNWTGDIDLFVQTGDIIDRGTDTIKLYMWLEQLRSQARAAGGDVVSHLGNHEWMNLLSDWRYVYPQEIKTFGSVAARQKMLQTGRIGRAWAANYSVTSRVPLYPPLGSESPFPGSSSQLVYDPSKGLSSVDYDPSAAQNNPLSHAALSFVHGGLAPSYKHLSPYPSAINEIGASLLRRLQSRPMPPPHPPAPYPGLPADATDDERGLYADDGPLWYRGWAFKKEEEVCAEVDEVLEKTGVRRLIMGHTPNFEHIQNRCGGKVIIIDTGISHAYGGALSALSVRYSLKPDLNDATRWKENEIVTALYLDREEVLVEQVREITNRPVS